MNPVPFDQADILRIFIQDELTYHSLRGVHMHDLLQQLLDDVQIVVAQSGQRNAYMLVFDTAFLRLFIKVLGAYVLVEG